MKNIVVILITLFFGGCFKYNLPNVSNQSYKNKKYKTTIYKRRIISIKNDQNMIKIKNANTNFVHKPIRQTNKTDRDFSNRHEKNKLIKNIAMKIKIDKFYNKKNRKFNVCFETKPLCFTKIYNNNKLIKNLNLGEIALYSGYDIKIYKQNGITYINSNESVVYPQNFIDILIYDNVELKENKIDSRKFCIIKEVDLKKANILIKDELILKADIKIFDDILYKGYIMKKPTKKDPTYIKAQYNLFKGYINKLVLYDKDTNEILSNFYNF